MLSIISKLRIKLNFLVRYKSFFLGNLPCVNQLKREVPIVVSIASKEKNFYDLELTLYSLLNQSVKPDRIILWLSDEYDLSELPYGITRFVKNGLEIRFVKDLGDYTKIIYPLTECPKSIIVTASDYVYYEKSWLKRLYHSYASSPNDIHAHLAGRVIFKNNAYGIKARKNTVVCENEEKARFDNLANGIGGVLFPPDCFRKEVFRADIYNTLSGTSDVWLWVMALLSERKTRIVKSHRRTLTCVNLIKFLREKFLNASVYNEQINSLLKFYGQNIEQKIKK